MKPNNFQRDSMAAVCDTSPRNSHVRLALSLLFVAALSCNLPAIGSLPPQGSELEIEAHAIRLQPDIVTYAVRLTNRGSAPLGDLTLEFAIPSGGTVQEVLTTSLTSEMQQGREQVSWKISGLSANTIIGPFAYRVSFNGEPSPVDVKASWKLPTPGAVTGHVTTVEEASQAETAADMVAGSLTEIAGSGTRYFVPFGDRGQVTLSRLDSDPPSGMAEGVAWVGAYKVSKEHPGSAIFVVALRRPARPFLLVRVFADSGQGIHEQATMGTVTSDGLHAVFSTDSASDYFLGVDSSRLNSSTADIARTAGKAVVSGALEALIAAKSALSEVHALEDLINSLRTDVVWVEGDSNGWVVFDTNTDDTGGTCASDANGITCSYGPDSGGACSGHGGGVEDSHAGSSGSVDYCADGSVFYCGPGGCQEGGGAAHETHVAETHAAETGTASAGIFPGPCPTMMCMIDTQTGDMFNYDQMYFSESLAGLLDLVNGNWTATDRAGFPAPPSTLNHIQGPSASTDVRGLQAVVGVAGNNMIFLIPGGQRWRTVVGMPVNPAGASAGPQETPSPLPTLTSTAVIVTSPPEPSTATFTPKPVPPADTDGPEIKAVSASPDSIFASKPKGCKETTSLISAGISDPSGVQSAVVIFVGPSAGSAPMSQAGGNKWQATLGPFGVAGTINYQIRAFDALGNRSDTEFSTLAIKACIP